MKIKIVCKNCDNIFLREKSNIRKGKPNFCSLKCSGIYNSTIKSNLPLKTKKDYTNGKKCPNCTLLKPLNEFYKRRNKTEPSVYCKICTNVQTSIRQRKLKQKCVEYKGSCCSICGYNQYQGALEFHHTDPSQKDFNLSKVRTTSFNDKIRVELDKCILLCSNCHKETHDKMRDGISNISKV